MAKFLNKENAVSELKDGDTIIGKQCGINSLG
jgi:hypothetical protein